MLVHLIYLLAIFDNVYNATSLEVIAANISEMLIAFVMLHKV